MRKTLRKLNKNGGNTMKIIIAIAITLYVNQPPLPPAPVMLAMRLTLSESNVKPKSSPNRYENAA